MADSTFPAASVDTEWNPGKNKNFLEDSGSSLVTTSMEIKEKVEAEERKQQKEKEKKDAAQMLKKSIIISAMVVAVAGAIFVLNKKSREK